MFPGETISTGASPTCDSCKESPELKVGIDSDIIAYNDIILYLNIRTNVAVVSNPAAIHVDKIPNFCIFSYFAVFDY